MDKHVRARCKSTGGVAAISERALERGMFPEWERVDGPAPSRPKPAAFPKRKAAEAVAENADSRSADESEE